MLDDRRRRSASETTDAVGRAWMVGEIDSSVVSQSVGGS
jgi:hypothetical protein